MVKTTIQFQSLKKREWSIVFSKFTISKREEYALQTTVPSQVPLWCNHKYTTRIPLNTIKLPEIHSVWRDQKLTSMVENPRRRRPSRFNPRSSALSPETIVYFGTSWETFRIQEKQKLQTWMGLKWFTNNQAINYRLQTYQ